MNVMMRLSVHWLCSSWMMETMVMMMRMILMGLMLYLVLTLARLEASEARGADIR